MLFLQEHEFISYQRKSFVTLIQKTRHAKEKKIILVDYFSFRF